MLSTQQNRALRKYFRMVSDTLNEAGMERKVLTSFGEMEIPWTMESVEELWKVAQAYMYHTESLRELEPNQVDPIYDVLNRFISSSRGIHIPFPNQESLQNEITTV